MYSALNGICFQLLVDISGDPKRLYLACAILSSTSGPLTHRSHRSTINIENCVIKFSDNPQPLPATPCHYWGNIIYFNWLNTIYILFDPCIWYTRTRPSLWYTEMWNPSLNTHSYDVACAQMPTETSSKVLWQLYSSGKCVSDTPGCHSPTKPLHHLHPQTRGKDKAVGPNPMEQVVVFYWSSCSPMTIALPLVQSSRFSVVIKNFTDTASGHVHHHNNLALRIASSKYLAICCSTWCGTFHSNISASSTVVSKVY